MGGHAPLGACCAGLSFGFPQVLAPCPNNGYNALVKRHLAAPEFVCRDKFRNVFLLQLKEVFRLAFRSNLSTDYGLEAAWRVGKTRAKLAMIDKSKLFDKLKLTQARASIKHEVVSKTPKKARVIQAHKNEATAYHLPHEYLALNCALKACATHQFECCGVELQLVYAGGYNHDELSDITSTWLQLPGSMLIDECDGKNWDATMQAPLLAAEAAVYAAVGARAHLDVTTRNTCVDGKLWCRDFGIKQRFKIKYVTSQKRLSGDFNTSLGNSMISMIVAYNVLTSLPPQLKPKTAKMLFMGDDYVGFYFWAGRAPCPIELKRALNDGWSSFGISPERGLFDDPFHISFISLTLWPRRNGGVQWVPMIGKQCLKLFWTAKRCSPKFATAIANGIAQGFWFVYYGHPLMMRMLKRHYNPQKPSIKWDHYFSDMLTQTNREIDWRWGNCIKYGVPLSAANFELPSVNAVLKHPFVDHMLQLDLLDPADRKACLA
jgi:hypothetical protein